MIPTKQDRLNDIAAMAWLAELWGEYVERAEYQQPPRASLSLYESQWGRRTPELRISATTFGGAGTTAGDRLMHLSKLVRDLTDGALTADTYMYGSTSAEYTLSGRMPLGEEHEALFKIELNPEDFLLGTADVPRHGLVWTLTPRQIVQIGRPIVWAKRWTVPVTPSRRYNPEAAGWLERECGYCDEIVPHEDDLTMSRDHGYVCADCVEYLIESEREA